MTIIPNEKQNNVTIHQRDPVGQFEADVNGDGLLEIIVVEKRIIQHKRLKVYIAIFDQNNSLLKESYFSPGNLSGEKFDSTIVEAKIVNVGESIPPVILIRQIVTEKSEGFVSDPYWFRYITLRKIEGTVVFGLAECEDGNKSKDFTLLFNAITLWWFYYYPQKSEKGIPQGLEGDFRYSVEKKDIKFKDINKDGMDDILMSYKTYQHSFGPDLRAGKLVEIPKIKPGEIIEKYFQKEKTYQYIRKSGGFTLLRP